MAKIWVRESVSVEILRFAQDDTMLDSGSSYVVAGRRLGSCGRNGENGFRASDIFKAVVGAHRNRVLTCIETACQSLDGELIVFFGGIADPTDWCNEDPFAAVNAVLGSLNATPSVPCNELGFDTDKGLGPTSRGKGDRLQPFDYRRCVVDLEAIAFAFGFQREGGRIRRRVAGDDFQVVSAIRQRGGIPRIEFLLEVVLQ